MAHHSRRTTLGIISDAQIFRCMPLLGRNRSSLFNCGLNIVEVLQDSLSDHALEQNHGE